MNMMNTNDSLEQLSSENALDFVCVRNVCMYLPPKKSNARCCADRLYVSCMIIFPVIVDVLVRDRYAKMVLDKCETQTLSLLKTVECECADEAFTLCMDI